MPKYDISCPHGHTSEVVKSMNAPLPPCPVCGDAAVTQVLPVTPFALRGQGWAKDGYSRGTKA